MCIFIHPACAKEYFGANCSRKCSPHCKSDTCQHADGSCTCTAGWMGYNCTTGNAIYKDIFLEKVLNVLRQKRHKNHFYNFLNDIFELDFK